MKIAIIRGAIMALIVSISSLGFGASLLESVVGDFSNNGLSPNGFALDKNGANPLSGSSQGGDKDYVTVTVKSGSWLTSLVLTSYVSNDGRAFIGMMSGPQFTESSTSTNVANLMGYTHFGTGAGNVGGDLFTNMKTAAGAQGFSTPLGAGTYSFWIQQLGAKTDYTMTFNTVPEPGTLLALAAGAAALARRRKSR
jgi:hypothetical protein